MGFPLEPLLGHVFMTELEKDIIDTRDMQLLEMRVLIIRIIWILSNHSHKKRKDSLETPYLAQF